MSSVSESSSPALNVTSDRIGAEVVFATDEWFACAKNLIKAEYPVFDPDAFCSQGKVMDGWESRRKRTEGHDWCIIKLGYPAYCTAVEFDTRWFTGNFVPKCSVQAVALTDEQAAVFDSLPGRADGRLGTQGTGMTREEVVQCQATIEGLGDWKELVAVTPMGAGFEDTSVTKVAITPEQSAAVGRVTHVRLNYFPDGGVARFKVFGHVAYDFSQDIAKGTIMDLAYAGHGGKGIAWSNEHYGVPSNLLQPGRGVNMGDGWETARHPHRAASVEIDATTGISTSTLSDWCVLRLGRSTAAVEKLVLDTCHFKGNFPESAQVEAASLTDKEEADVDTCSDKWFPLLARTRLTADAIHEFSGDSLVPPPTGSESITHLRVTIFPDGGIMRVRAFGKPRAA